MGRICDWNIAFRKKMKEKAEITGDSQPVRYRSICLLSHDPSLTKMRSRVNDDNDILTPNRGFDPISQTEIIPQS